MTKTIKHSAGTRLEQNPCIYLHSMLQTYTYNPNPMTKQSRRCCHRPPTARTAKATSQRPPIRLRHS